MIYDIPLTSLMHITGWNTLSPVHGLQRDFWDNYSEPLDAPQFIPGGSHVVSYDGFIGSSICFWLSGPRRN